MNYQKIYDDICKRGQERILPKEVYTEKHHVIPKCLGGTNEKSNLTVLTANEHFLVHYILAEKLYPTHYGLYHALYIMCHLKGKSQSRHRPSSKTYENIRETAILRMKQYKKENPLSGEQNPMFGKTHSPEVKRQQSERMMGNQTRLGISHTEETKQKIRDTKQKNKENGFVCKKYPPRTEAHCQNISISVNLSYKNGRKGSFTGKLHTDETKKKLSIKRKNTQIGDDNPNSRQLIHIGTGLIFNSRKSAQEHFNISSYKIGVQLKNGIFKDLSGKLQ